MKYSTVEDVMVSFPHPIVPTVEGDPDYQTIPATRKFLEANSRVIDTHLGGGTLGHLGLIISDAFYSNIAPPTVEAPKFWETPNTPNRAPATKDRMAAQISAAHHVWEEDVQTYRTCTSVQQTLKKHIISIFKPMYLEILNDTMVGYANISARDMLDHLFETYGNITAVDLEINFEHTRPDWDPQQQVETLLKQIQDCADYSEAWGVPIGPSQQINVGYAKKMQQGTSWAHVAVGTRNQPLKKLGLTSNPTSQPLTVSTSKCRGRPLQTLDTTQLTPPWPRMEIRWLKLPLALWKIWQQQLNRTEVWWQR
jgi:hypothetical protein